MTSQFNMNCCSAHQFDWLVLLELAAKSRTQRTNTNKVIVDWPKNPRFCRTFEGWFGPTVFRKSLLCSSGNSSWVIQGERLFLTLFGLNSAFLSVTLVNRRSQSPTFHLGYRCVVTRFQSIMRRSRKNSASFKFLSCRTSTVLCISERRWVTLRLR